jgi:hypothetical protein
MKLRFVCVVIGLLSLVSLTVAQTSTPNTSFLPRLVRFGGTVKDLNGNPMTGGVGITFALYSEKTGGTPLWLETQNANADRGGHYMVLLGSTKPEGLPAELFTSEQARWVGVQVSGQAEQPRVELVSAPYALKAGDAETVGGLPPSAFMLAAPVDGKSTVTASENAGTAPPPASNVTTAGGTVNTIPLWTTGTSIQDSDLTQTGSGTTKRIGIGTTTPTSTLDVKGGATVRGALILPATGVATATAGKNSQSEHLIASSFSSATNTAVNQTFQWQAEPAQNNTAIPGATLNLLYGQGTAVPAETGLRIGPKGIIGFAAGQTFLGVGTITGVTAGTDLTGGGTSGKVTLNLDTTKVPQLAANNTFSGNNTFNAATTFHALAVSVKASGALGPTLTLTNPGGAGGSPTNAGTATSIDFNSYLPAAEPEGPLPEARIEAVDNGFYSDGLIFYTKFPSGASSFLQQDLTIQANGQTAVGLPTSGTLPTLTAQLTVFNTGPTGWDGIDTTGGAEVGSGISATGGDETANSSIQGGTGGSFTGGFSPGTTGDGIFATPGDATFSSGAGWAGLFVGDIDVTGAIFAGVKDFKIDHPLDPANKYLVHASVESSEMMNIYSGNVVTDELGVATVKLPDWFEAENTDFRYQLTVIGGRFAQAIVSKEIADHQFTISTNASNVKVSWQVTAVREDAYAKAHPLVVEQQKPAHERGFYQNPELFGQPAEKQTEWGRNPRQMQHMKAMRAQQKLQSPRHAAPQRPAASVVQSPAPEAQLKPLSQVESK